MAATLFRFRAKPVLTKLLRHLAAVSLLLPALAQAQGKVLYVTHEPGRWHDYTQQRQAFEGVAEAAGWELNVASGDKDTMLAFLRSADYAAEQDAVVYNFCLADSRDMEAMENLVRQTAELGVPALLVHCAMHSWWDTFKKGKAISGNDLGLARANKRLLKSWAEQHPERPLPAWGDFTGVASTAHGPKKPIALTAATPHPLSADLPAGYHTGNTELYNNHYVTPDVVALIQGKQGKDEAIVAWLAPRGKSQVMGLTLGHDSDEWEDPVFLQLLSNAVNFLIAGE